MPDDRAHKDRLLGSLESRSATIAVVGLGYVGLPLLLRFSDAGFRVLGFDNDPAKIEALAAGRCYIGHIGGERVAGALRSGFELTGDIARIGEADVVILCLPTPLGTHRDPDLHYVLDTVDAIVPHLRAGQAIALESTTYPGTTEEELRPRIESSGLTVGEEVFLVYSPEREDPGNATFSVERIPKICGGVTAACLEVGRALYGAAIERVVPVSSTQVAELAKLLENIHRAVNIGLVNEMKIVADRMGIDIHEVIDAAATKPFGFVPYQPGPGLGGHCIPIDPFYLTWKAREYGIETRFIELAGEVNSAMPDYVVTKVTEALNAHGKPVSGSRIMVLGAAYKKNVGDIRESPALVLIERLQHLGAAVSYSDPHMPALPKTRKHDLRLESTPLTDRALAAADCVLIATDHDAFDYDLIEDHAPLIVDTRGRYRGGAEHIFKA